MEELLVRVLERFTARITVRQRAMYGSDVPFIEKWRRAMAYIDEDLASGYPKVWMELEAMAWNRPEFRERLIGVHDEWHALLSDAISRAVDEYGLDRDTFPLQGMTALVKTFNLGMLLERLIGDREHHGALLAMIDEYLQSLERRKP